MVNDEIHTKQLAAILVERFANPFHHSSMNDGSIDWQKTYNAMQDAIASGESMPTVLSAALIEISGHDPWGDKDDTMV